MLSLAGNCEINISVKVLLINSSKFHFIQVLWNQFGYDNSFLFYIYFSNIRRFPYCFYSEISSTENLPTYDKRTKNRSKLKTLVPKSGRETLLPIWHLYFNLALFILI